MAKIKVDFTNIKKLTNDIYYPLYNNKDRYLVCYGGAGSGKSVFIAQKIIYRMLTEQGHRFLVCRKVAKHIRGSVYQLLLDIINQWGLAKLFTTNKTDMEIKCINGNKIIMVGLDDVDKLKSIAGITSIWIEEADQITQEDLQQLNLRLRGLNNLYKQIMITFNPVSNLHWLKGYFFDNPIDNSTIVKSTYLDNRFIDEEYKKEIESLKDKDPTYYMIYALGEWGVLGELIYRNWEVQDISIDDSNYQYITYGLDFGYNDPTVLLKVGLEDNCIYIIDELYRRKTTNSDLIELSKDKAKKNQLIIADSAEPDRIEQFRREGFRIKAVKKGKGSIKSGIDFVKSKKIFVHPSCINTIKELSIYKYKQDKEGNILDEPVAAFDHCMDALRYAVSEFNPKSQWGWKKKSR